MPSHNLNRLLGMAFAGGVTALAGAALAQAPGAQGPKQVGVVTVETEAVALSATSPGRAVAQDEVDIRPRVDGVVSEVVYNPGERIAAGAPMFRIDPSTYNAAVAQSQADVASAEAAVVEAQGTYDRTNALQARAASKAELDTARATLDKANAAVESAQAALTLAQTQLSWTTIPSPLDGLPSVSAVSVGDLVTAGQSTAMATVTKLDPIDVDIYEPSANLQRMRERIESGQIKLNDAIRAQLTLENGVTYSATGELVAPGFTVSTSTGAVDFRFRFSNPEQRILPGMFVRSTVELGTIDAVLVPQLAATRARDGVLSAWVVENGKAASRVLTEEGVNGNSWIITGGLNAGDQLIVNGTSGLTAGADVQAVPATIDDNGVVSDAAATAAAAGGSTAGATTTGTPATAAPATSGEAAPATTGTPAATDAAATTAPAAAPAGDAPAATAQPTE